MRILVVDDDEDVRSVVARGLRADGHAVSTAIDLATARAAMGDEVDLVVLDLRLPDGFGLEFCREFRVHRPSTPILILSALSQVALRVAGLDAGADDFLAKPFALAELKARVRALGRRGAVPRGRSYQRGEVWLDTAGRAAKRGGRTVAITAKEWAILEMLARRPGHVVSRSSLLDGVWGEDGDSAAASLEVLIGRLRRKLGVDVIHTLRGAGYALAEEDGRA